MINKYLQKRIIIFILIIIICIVILLFPDSNKEFNNIKTTYKDEYTNPIYLLDNNNYVVLTMAKYDNKNTINDIKEIINTLKINSNNIMDGFKQIIPTDTKILSIDLKDGLLKINFSKELLNVSKDNEEKLIECLVYSLTNLEDVKNIMIFIEGNSLLKLPQTNKDLPILLNRSIGINKEYSITSFKDTYLTNIYYVSKYNDNYYYVPVSLISNNNKTKIEIIIDELKSSTTLKTNLISYLKSNVLLTNYEIRENEIDLSFNNELLTNISSKELLEEVKYTIYLSIKDSYNIDNVSFFVEDKKIMEINK